MIIVRSKDMKYIDRKTIFDFNIPGLLLMEHAALRVCDEIPKGAQYIAVICGTGNNGGDGFAVARNLSLQGKTVTVIGLGDLKHLKGDALSMYQSICSLDLNIHWYEQSQDFMVTSILHDSDVIIDAIFGIGCNRVIQGDYLKIIQHINKAKAFTISVDIPSGVNSDNGKIMGISVNANMTVSFTLPKLGNLLFPGALSSKSLKVVDIGVPQMALEGQNYDYETIDHNSLCNMPKRSPISHKNTYGRVLIIAGSEGMSGAAFLSAKAAYRSGVGLVEIVTHESCHTSLQTSLPEAIITTYNDNVDVIINYIASHLDLYKAILIGPGLSVSDESLLLLEFVLAQPNLPVVIDADGLNLLAAHMELLETCIVPLVLTPHIGEMSRLTQYSSGAILENTLEFAQAFSKTNRVITVLKSGRTVVSTPEGRCCINTCGNHGMATAGSGDALSGVIVSLLGQGAEPNISAVLGVAIHSMAGDIAAEDKGYYGLMASDIIEAIPKVLRDTL